MNKKSVLILLLIVLVVFPLISSQCEDPDGNFGEFFDKYYPYTFGGVVVDKCTDEDNLLEVVCKNGIEDTEPRNCNNGCIEPFGQPSYCRCVENDQCLGGICDVDSGRCSSSSQTDSKIGCFDSDRDEDTRKGDYDDAEAESRIIGFVDYKGERSNDKCINDETHAEARCNLQGSFYFQHTCQNGCDQINGICLSESDNEDGNQGNSPETPNTNGGPVTKQPPPSSPTTVSQNQVKDCFDIIVDRRAKVEAEFIATGICRKYSCKNAQTIDIDEWVCPAGYECSPDLEIPCVVIEKVVEDSIDDKLAGLIFEEVGGLGVPCAPEKNECKKGLTCWPKKTRDEVGKETTIFTCQNRGLITNIAEWVNDLFKGGEIICRENSCRRDYYNTIDLISGKKVADYGYISTITCTNGDWETSEKKSCELEDLLRLPIKIDSIDGEIRISNEEGLISRISKRNDKGIKLEFPLNRENEDEGGFVGGGKKPLLIMSRLIEEKIKTTVLGDLEEPRTRILLGEIDCYDFDANEFKPFEVKGECIDYTGKSVKDSSLEGRNRAQFPRLINNIIPITGNVVKDSLEKDRLDENSILKNDDEVRPVPPKKIGFAKGAINALRNGIVIKLGKGINAPKFKFEATDYVEYYCKFPKKGTVPEEDEINKRCIGKKINCIKEGYGYQINGRCVKSICSEDEEGSDPSFKGTVKYESEEGLKIRPDYCLPNGNLVDEVCIGDANEIIIYECSDGCEDGVGKGECVQIKS